MSISKGARINSANLVLLLDASFTKSYPGTGQVWYDLSSINNHATLSNGAYYSDNTMLFDGTNDVAYLNNGINIHQQSYTICAWIKRNSGIGIHGIMSDLQYGYWGFYVNANSKLVMRHWYVEYLANELIGNTVIDGDWTHVAGVFDVNSGMKLYINGVLDNSNSNTGAAFIPYATRGPQYIGQYKNDAGNLNTNVMNGKISNIYFYDRALSDEEIRYNFLLKESIYRKDIPFYDESNNCIPYLSNWDNKNVFYMNQMGPYYKVSSHGYVSGPETYNFTLNNLPAHTKIRYKCIWHMLDSLDGETSYLYTSDSSNTLTERARFTKTVNSNPPTFSIRNGVEYYWSGAGYVYTNTSPTWNFEGFVIFDTDYYNHSLSSFSARHILGADQPQSDEAMYISHVQVYLK